MIVYPNSKYLAREVIYNKGDHISETRLTQNANYTRSKASIDFSKTLGRESRVISHNRFGAKVPEVYKHGIDVSHKRFATQPGERFNSDDDGEGEEEELPEVEDYNADT